MARIRPLLLLALLCRAPAAPAAEAGPTPVEVRALAVYPYAFGWEEPAYRSLLKSSDALAEAARLPLDVIPPTEFQVTRPEAANVLAGSDAAKAVARRGHPPRAFAALRAWAERTGPRSVSAADEGGVAASALRDESTVQAHVQVVDAATGEVLAQASGRVPGAEEPSPGGDPLPQLTALHRRLVAEALRALEARLAPGRPRAAGRGLEPAAFESFALPGRPSLKETAARDPVAGAAARREIQSYLARR